jgi:phosphoribosylglycinamide formyltransferase-1
MTNIAIFASHNGSGFDTLYKAQQDKLLDIDIKLVISNNTDAQVIKNSKKHNINSHIINSKTSENVDEKIYNLLEEQNCEYVFLSGYMKKLSAKITKNFKVINSHPSLLPKFGGAKMYGRYVHETVIQSKDSISGVTIHKVNENYDDGEIILQKELVLSKDETAQSLEIKIKNLEKIAIIEGFKKCLK